MHFYQPQRSCGQGNIFTPVCHSFCSQGGGSVSVHVGIPPPPPSRPPLEPTHTPLPREANSGIRSTCGRYASYWNAFLPFINICYCKNAFQEDAYRLLQWLSRGGVSSRGCLYRGDVCPRYTPPCPLHAGIHIRPAHCMLGYPPPP